MLAWPGIDGNFDGICGTKTSNVLNVVLNIGLNILLNIVKCSFKYSVT